MQITNLRMGVFQLVRISEDLNLYSDLSLLKSQVLSLLNAGERHIALRFTPDSYFSSASISALVSCFELIREAEGHAAIITPNHSLLHLLSIIDIDSSILVYESEKRLLEPAV
jgi:anti-anti-sigma regulatory factor